MPTQADQPTNSTATINLHHAPGAPAVALLPGRPSAAGDAPGAWDPLLEVATYKHHKDNDPRTLSVRWSAFTRGLSEHRRGDCTVADCVGSECRHKYGAAWSPIQIIGKRHKDNVRAITLIAVDLDHLDPTAPYAWAPALEGLATFVHTSHNHRPQSPRLRLVLVPNRPVLASEWPRFWPAFVARYKLPADPACKDLSRLYFGSSAPIGSEAWALNQEGATVDVDSILALSPVPVDTFGAVSTSPRTTTPITTTATGRERAVEILTAAWPAPKTGERNEARGALAGALAMMDMDESEIADLVFEVDGGNRTEAVNWSRSSVRDVEAGTPVTGWPTLYGTEGKPPLVDPVAVHAAMRALGVLVPATPGDRAMLPSAMMTNIASTPITVSASSGVWTDGQIGAMLKPERNSTSPRPCGSNIALILEHRGHLRFNDLTKSVEVTGGRFAREAPNDLPIAIKNWLEDQFLMFANKAEVCDQLLYVARKNNYNPVATYLDSLRWDGVTRIGGTPGPWSDGLHPGWLSAYCGSSDDEHTSRVGAMFLIGAVARALDPGPDCKVDTVLTLVGKQGAMKSTALRILAGGWFTDTPIRLGDKDGYMVAASTWIVELAELSSLKDAEAAYERHKAFLSSASDMYRPPYGRALESFPRRCVFAGSTNAEQYLADPSGNRRHWSAWVERVDVDALARDRDQLWAEAVHRYREGLAYKPTDRPVHLRWWLKDEEQDLADTANLERTEDDAWADEIAIWIDKQKVPPDHKGWSTAQIALGALRISTLELKRHEAHVVKACGKAGLVKSRHQPRVDGKKGPRLWSRLSASAPQPPFQTFLEV